MTVEMFRFNNFQQVSHNLDWSKSNEILLKGTIYNFIVTNSFT